MSRAEVSPVAATRSPAPVMGRLDSLDGLRAVAVLLVFVAHLDQRLFTGGFVGVEVFFVISGYLITTLLLREHEAHGRLHLRRFYVRRMLRLWPALVVATVVVTPIAAADHVGRPLLDGAAAIGYLTDFWANYAGTPSLVLHTWSLAVEEQFYLLWPAALALLLVRGGSPTRVLALAAAASVALTFLLPRLIHVPVPQYLPVAHVAELASGAWLALAQRAGSVPRVVRAVVARSTVTAAALLALVAAEFVLPVRWWSWPASTLFCWPIVAHLVLVDDGPVHRLLSRRVPVWLGRRSYGFYLWHYPVVILLLRPLGSWDTLMLGLAITVAAAALSYELVERPFLALKRRFAEVRVTDGA